MGSLCEVCARVRARMRGRVVPGDDDPHPSHRATASPTDDHLCHAAHRASEEFMCELTHHVGVAVLVLNDVRNVHSMQIKYGMSMITDG